MPKKVRFYDEPVVVYKSILVEISKDYDKELKTESGIVIADSKGFQECESMYGRVVSIAPRALLVDDEPIRDVSIGDIVLFAKYGGTEFYDRHVDRRFRLLRLNDILAVVGDTDE